jgi:predicted flap endonuclease-1-like 5' DNA nuclease
MLKRRGILASDDYKFSWWWFGIKVGIVTALIVWWWLDNRDKKTRVKELDTAGNGEIPLVPIPDDEMPEETAPAPEVDDLTKIEGIGPKISTTLQAAGIHSYRQLAAFDTPSLKKILTDGGIRVGFPETWPEQAALAAKADWTKLEELQSSLQGGRRVS